MLKTPEDLERERREAEDKKSPIGFAGAVIIVLGALAIYFFVNATPEKKAVDPKAPAAMTDSVQCQRLVDIYARDGVVRGSRIGNRISVDKQKWTALADDARLNLLNYIACANYSGRNLEQLDSDEFVYVYSIDDGNLIAKAGTQGLLLL
jgi:hypothetical protein